MNPGTAKVGDLVTLTIQVTHPEALPLENAILPKTLGTFEVYSSTRLAPISDGNKARDEFQAVLQNFATGQQVVPSIVIPYRDPMGKDHSVKTPEIKVMIEEMPPGPKDKGDIRGIKGVIGPTAISPLWWLVILALAVGTAFLLWRKRQLTLAGPPPPPPVPADITALEKLRALAQTDWLATGKIKEFYSAISDIVRGYLEGQFRVPALERTTNELMRDLRKKSDVTMDLQAELQTLLESADLVKFAKFRPDASEGSQALAAAIKFVEKTRDVTPAAVSRGPEVLA